MTSPEADVSRSASERLERERSFHDDRFAHNPGRSRALGSVTGLITLDALTTAYHAVKPLCPGAAVLDYGCAQGEASVLLAKYGAASVQGIDLSPVAVNQAREYARSAGFPDLRFQAMNAEELTFGPGEFDVVFGIGILHHLDVNRACSEIGRVLKPGGRAVFLEPLGHNPLINAVRRLTPNARTSDEHPLTMADLRAIRAYFEWVELDYVNLTTLLTAPFVAVPGRVRAQHLFARVDRILFSAVPWVGRFAWNVVIRLGRPVTRRSD